jgi:O-antigen ligase
MTFTLVNCLLLAALLFWVVDWNNSYLSLMHWSEKHLGNLHNLNNLIFISDLLALTLLLKAKEQRNKLLAGGCLLLLLFASVLVKSEGSSIALAITLLALLALYSRGRWRLLLAGFAILPVILLHLFYMDPDLFSWLTGYHSNTLTIRSGIYQQLLSAWQQHPWSGWGFNTYKYVDETRVNGVKFIYPHHIYLEAMFSLGIAGSAVVLAWIANALRKIDLSRIQQSAVGLLAFLALIYISAKGMSDLKLLSQQTVGWIAVCLGLLHGRTQLLRQEKKSYH